MTTTIRVRKKTMSQPFDRQNSLAVYLIANGPLQMSAGKLAAQAFQVCQRLHKEADKRAKNGDLTLQNLLTKWEQNGTCTITRNAETPAVFNRAISELDGALMIDEGLTEVPANSATIFATIPIKRCDAPQILKHKKIRLLQEKK